MTDATDTADVAVTDRGELMLVLQGETYGLRPSYDAIEKIEATLGRGLVDIAGDALAAKLKLGELAQVATECVREWGRSAEHKGAAGANAKRIGKLILDSEGGMLVVQKRISTMLSLAVTGGYDSEGNLKPAATTTSEEAPAAG